MSSLISDLDTAPAQGDGDFVQNILNEINGGPGGGGGGGGGGVIQAPPAVGSMAPPQMIHAPNPNTIAPHVMDNGPATAHMIGNQHPTPADFAHIMSGAGAVAAAPQGGESWGAAYAPPTAPMRVAAPKRSWWSKSMDELRTPFLVAILVFVFGLPVVNFLFAHYLPSMVKPTGELNPIGSVIKALAAGASFWVLQRVVVPLLSN